MPINISTHLPSQDSIFNTLNYCPGVSSLFNIGLIAAKKFYIPRLESNAIADNHFYCRIDTQSYERCFFLIIPGASILIGIYDFINKDYFNKKYVLEHLRDENFHCSWISDRLLGDPDFLLEASQIRSGLLLWSKNDRLKKDRAFIKKLVKYDSSCLLSTPLRHDRDFILDGLREQEIDANGIVYTTLRKDLEFMVEAIKINGEAIWAAPEEVRRNEKLVRAAINNGCLQAITCGKDNETIINDFNLFVSILQQDAEYFQYALLGNFTEDQYQSLRDIALRQNPQSIIHDLTLASDQFAYDAEHKTITITL